MAPMDQYMAYNMNLYRAFEKSTNTKYRICLAKIE